MNSISTPNIYKLEFGVDCPDNIVLPEIFFKTTMKDSDLVMLMKVWMYKLAEYVEEYFFEEEEMMELLEAFECMQIGGDDGFVSFYLADMYEIWEAANIRPTEDDMNNTSFYNENAQKVFDKVLRRNDQETVECGLRDENYKKWGESSRKDFDGAMNRLGLTL